MMKEGELREREFTIKPNGLVLDNSGNEYRNEDGEIEFLEESEEIRKKYVNEYYLEV